MRAHLHNSGAMAGWRRPAHLNPNPNLNLNPVPCRAGERLGLRLRVRLGLRGLGGAAVLLSFLAVSSFGAIAESDSPASPQQLYNHGTEKFREGKLREAEAALQMAVVSQNEKVQIPALYNLERGLGLTQFA